MESKVIVMGEAELSALIYTCAAKAVRDHLNKQVLNLSEARDALGSVSAGKVFKLIKDGKLKPLDRAGTKGSPLQFSRTEIDNFLTSKSQK